VYAIKNTSYVLIQQRSQVLPNKALEFANEFLELFKSVNFSRLIIVSGVSAECITDDFMLTR
jgi:predicted ATP-grasp superfamily ATP-dependent carboligase